MSKGKVHPERSSVDWKLVGRRIRELRGFDLTQEEFARRIGVSQNYLSTYGAREGADRLRDPLENQSGVWENNRVVADGKGVEPNREDARRAIFGKLFFGHIIGTRESFMWTSQLLI